MAKQVKVDPTTGSQNWQSKFGAAGAAYTAGVKAVTEAPGAAAAAALPRWIAAMTSKEVQDKFVRKVSAVSLVEWQGAATSIGAQRLSTGAAKGAPKYASFAAKFYPFLSGNMAKVSAMPNITLEDRIARSAAMQRLNAGFKG